MSEVVILLSGKLICRVRSSGDVKLGIMFSPASVKREKTELPWTREKSIARWRRWAKALRDIGITGIHILLPTRAKPLLSLGPARMKTSRRFLLTLKVCTAPRCEYDSEVFHR